VCVRMRVCVRACICVHACVRGAVAWSAPASRQGPTCTSVARDVSCTLPSRADCLERREPAGICVCKLGRAAGVRVCKLGPAGLRKRKVLCGDWDA